MWLLTITGDFTKYELTDDQRDYYVQSCQNGQELIEFSDGRIFSSKMNSLVRSENEIENDPMWKQYIQLGNEDADVRRKMQIEKYLNTRYPYERNVHDWNEIKGIDDSVLRLERSSNERKLNEGGSNA